MADLLNGAVAGVIAVFLSVVLVATAMEGGMPIRQDLTPGPAPSPARGDQARDLPGPVRPSGASLLEKPADDAAQEATEGLAKEKRPDRPARGHRGGDGGCPSTCGHPEPGRGPDGERGIGNEGKDRHAKDPDRDREARDREREQRERERERDKEEGKKEHERRDQERDRERQERERDRDGEKERDKGDKERKAQEREREHRERDRHDGRHRDGDRRERDRERDD